MSKLKLTKAIALGALLLSATLLAGCGGGSNGLDGTYMNSDGSETMQFNSSGQFYDTTLNVTNEAPFKVDGDKIIIKGLIENSVLTREKNGSIQASDGTTFTKLKPAGGHLNGTYKANDGSGSLQFDSSGQVSMTISVGTQAGTYGGTYKVYGDKVIIRSSLGGGGYMGQGFMQAFTREKDGSLKDHGTTFSKMKRS